MLYEKMRKQSINQTSSLKEQCHELRMRHFIAQLEKFSLNFSSLLLKFKMASLPGTKAHGKPHGGKRENCGRKKKFQGDQCFKCVDIININSLFSLQVHLHV